jgi:hypothetical protein
MDIYLLEHPQVKRRLYDLLCGLILGRFFVPEPSSFTVWSLGLGVRELKIQSLGFGVREQKNL